VDTSDNGVRALSLHVTNSFDVEDGVIIDSNGIHGKKGAEELEFPRRIYIPFYSLFVLFTDYNGVESKAVKPIPAELILTLGRPNPLPTLKYCCRCPPYLLVRRTDWAQIRV
jgi:hypothetical protein